MAKWTLYYGGQELVSGLSNGARKKLETMVSSVVSRGEGGWFTAGNPSGPGAFSVYLQPGVAVTFVSDDALNSDLGDDAPDSITIDISAS